jgi:endonuclease/exonuclease/phosphatase family metal-dependent hydrolase
VSRTRPEEKIVIHSPRRLTRTICALGALGVGIVGSAAAAEAGPARPAAPAAPTGLTIAANANGLALFWNGHRASTFTVEQATDAAMDAGVVNYTIHNGYTQFTPYQVTPGQTYYFRVRAESGSSGSAYSGVVTASPVNAMQQIRVMTYNIQETQADGTRTGSGAIVAPWLKRRPGQVTLIRKNAPDVVAVEEGASWIGPTSNRVRQVDSLERALGSPYTLAKTEPVYPARHWFRTGDYILFNSDKWFPGTRRGYFHVGYSKFGVYQMLISRSTGAHVLFVATHLSTGSTHANELDRQKETKVLFSNGARLSHLTSSRVPVFYAGDFNSATATDPNFTMDSTLAPALASGYDDAFFVAGTTINARYDSSNLDRRTPPHSADRIDRIFTAAGVASVRAGIEMNPNSGPIPSDHNPVWADLLFPYAG